MSTKCANCGSTIPAGADTTRCPSCSLQFVNSSDALLKALLERLKDLTVSEMTNPFDSQQLGSPADLLSHIRNLSGPKMARGGELPSPVGDLLTQIAAQSHFEERYEQRGKLAEGGMGEVHRAFDRIIKREVAIKMMKGNSPNQPDSSDIRAQFLKEAQIGGRLLHPNILPVFDLGVNRDGAIYYTMRLVGGDSLQNCLDALDKGVATKFVSFPLRRFVEAFMAACEGVDYAHQNGVIHLDLKPQNILVSGFKEVFVIDWGLARVDDIDDTQRLINLFDLHGLGLYINTAVVNGKAVGTPAYMAPEQAAGNVREYGPNADIYGLGGILFYTLYGKVPNQGSNMKERLAASGSQKKREKLRTGIIPRGQRISREAQNAIDALGAICLKALDPDPKKRHACVEQLIIELKEWLDSAPALP